MVTGLQNELSGVLVVQQAQAGVTVLEGRLVEKPVIDRMMRILALAKAAGLRSR